MVLNYFSYLNVNNNEVYDGPEGSEFNATGYSSRNSKLISRNSKFNSRNLKFNSRNSKLISRNSNDTFISFNSRFYFIQLKITLHAIRDTNFTQLQFPNYIIFLVFQIISSTFYHQVFKIIGQLFYCSVIRKGGKIFLFLLY